MIDSVNIKITDREYPALDVIKDAMKSPNDWEGRHTDIGNGEWFPFTDWRHWGMDKLIGTKLCRVYTEPKPSEDAPVSYNEFLRVRASGETWIARRLPGGSWHEQKYWTTWSEGFRSACEWKRATTERPIPTEQAALLPVIPTLLVQTLRGELAALTAALEQERSKRKELEAMAERITSIGYNMQSDGSAILHLVEGSKVRICSSSIPSGAYRVLLEKVGD